MTTIGSTTSFFTSFVRMLIKEGHSIDFATNEGCGETPVPQYYKDWGCKVYDLSCSRSPIKYGNIKAIKELKKIIKNNSYDIIHCHTPIAAAITRIACKRYRKKSLKVVYTAHGFHFYNGAPLKNWILYYPVEWLCSFWTDVLITINKEDYIRANHKLHAKKIVYVPGVGIDIEKFALKGNGNLKIRNELNIPQDRKLLLSVGELNINKNHIAVIKAIKGIENITYVIVGKGDLENEIKKLAVELGVDIRLTGFRSDVVDFYDAADIYILPSIREGLNVSLMEAMASSLPCLCGRIRGNVDLVDEDGGYLFEPNNSDSIREAVMKAIDNTDGMGQYNLKKIKSFELNSVNRIMKELYLTAIGE